MSTILPTTRTMPHWLARVIERDYCPAAEPYIAWLRQPVGWFVVATLASILVGVTISPMALSMAAGLMALLVIGLAYPWLAVRLASCELISQLNQLVEDDAHDVQMRVHNACPWPLWGLIVEGFVVSPIDEAQQTVDEQSSADIALGCVPWLSQATYRLSIRPRLRGRYPLQSPQITCAFPFGLWTARRAIENVTPLVVHPKQVKLAGMTEQSGQSLHHFGTGSRAGGQGDFLGLRDYRVGDSIRQIHWAHTARMDALVVCERSAAEQSPWHIHVNIGTAQAGSLAARENLAWRIRIAASLCTLLHHQSVPFGLVIQDEANWYSASPKLHVGSRLEQAIERLTNIPLDGTRQSTQAPIHSSNHSAAHVPSGSAAGVFTIDSVRFSESYGEINQHHLIRLQHHRTTSNWRQAATTCEVIVDLDQPIAPQVNGWLQKLNQGRQAA